MFLKELWKLNPLKIFLDTTHSVPGMKTDTALFVNLENVGRILFQKIRAEKDYLLYLRLDSEDGQVILEGEVDASSYFWTKIFHIKKVHFLAKLKITSIEENTIRLKFTSYSLDNPGRVKWDLVRLFAKYDPFHKRKILFMIVDAYPEVLRLSPIFGEVLFNLNYFLYQVPSLAGKIRIVSADLQNGRAELYTRSSVILKPLMDFFGPEYVKISYQNKRKEY